VTLWGSPCWTASQPQMTLASEQRTYNWDGNGTLPAMSAEHTHDTNALILKWNWVKLNWNTMKLKWNCLETVFGKTICDLKHSKHKCNSLRCIAVLFYVVSDHTQQLLTFDESGWSIVENNITNRCKTFTPKLTANDEMLNVPIESTRLQICAKHVTLKTICQNNQHFAAVRKVS